MFMQCLLLSLSSCFYSLRIHIFKLNTCIYFCLCNNFCCRSTLISFIIFQFILVYRIETLAFNCVCYL